MASPILSKGWRTGLVAKRLEIPQDLFHHMLAHCRAEHPYEACGIMTGTGSVVRRGYALRNAHPHPATRYEIDPIDQYTAMHDVLAGREELVAIYHSHPTTPAYPSQTDVSMAFYPEAAYVIVSLAKDQPQVRAFQIVKGAVRPVECRVSDGGGGAWVDLR